MQDDNQTPQPGSGMPGMPPAGQQPYTVEQPAADNTPAPAMPQAVFSPGDVLQPGQPAAAAAASAAVPQASQPIQPPAPDQPTGWPTPAAPIAPEAPAVPAVPVTPMPNAMPGMVNPVTQKRKLPMVPLMIVAGVLVLAAVSFGLYKFVLNRVTLDDVNTARTSYNSLSDNAYDAGSAVRSLDTADTTAAFESKLKVFEAKIADAERQYNTLKDSPVQHNAKVHEKFQAFDKKWKPYVAFLRSSVKDSKTFLPIQIEFEAKLDELSKSPPSTTAELSTYLANFKTLVEGTAADLKDVKMTIEENQKMVESLQKFLTTTSGLIAKAQKDLAAGASTYTVTSHIYDISSASYDMNDELYTLQDQLYDKEKLLDPADEFNALGDSLRSLYNDLSK